MNKLYLVAESSSATNDSYEIFVTVRTGTSGNYNYAWEKVDTARIDLSNYLTTSNAQSTYLSKTDAASTYQPKGNYLTSHQPIPTGSVSQAGIVQIVDNLTTNDNTKVLSAKQGKALQDNKLDSTTAASTYVAIEDIEDMVGLSYDDTTGILTLTINTN